MKYQYNNLVLKVLHCYYEKGLTQQEIAGKFNISRIKVSRMISKAIADKIVQIKINIPAGSTSEIEKRLEESYGLSEAVVVNTSQVNLIAELGKAAAEYLMSRLQGNETIGITWGRFISASINALQPMNFPDVRIVQMLGGLGDPASDIHGTELVIRMAGILKAKARPLNSPGIVKSKEIRQALMENLQISDTLKLAEKATFAIMGIGTYDKSASLLTESSIISGEEIKRLVRKGAVGNICLRAFDEYGNPVPDEIDERVVGLTYDHIKKIPRIIGVAGGREKHQAILAAIRGKWLNTIITDDQTAGFLIDNSLKS